MFSERRDLDRFSDFSLILYRQIGSTFSHKPGGISALTPQIEIGRGQQIIQKAISTLAYLAVKACEVK